jgi:hypothetical protein
MQERNEHTAPGVAVRPITTDIYIYDRDGKFIYINSNKLGRWRDLDGVTLLGSSFLDVLPEGHKPWVDESFFQATQRGAASSFFTRGGDESSGFHGDVQQVLTRPSEKGGMIVQSSTYQADLVGSMVRSGLWFGKIPEGSIAWK